MASIPADCSTNGVVPDERTPALFVNALQNHGIRAVAFDMDQCLVAKHSRGRMTKEDFDNFAAHVTPDFVACVPAILKAGLFCAVATHSDRAEYGFHSPDVQPETHLLGEDLASRVLGKAVPDHAENFHIVAYNPDVRGVKETRMQAKNHHIREIAAHFGVEPQEVILFDDDVRNIAGTNECRAVKVDENTGFVLSNLPTDLFAYPANKELHKTYPVPPPPVPCGLQRFLLRFSGEHSDFAVDEFVSLLRIYRPGFTPALYPIVQSRDHITKCWAEGKGDFFTVLHWVDLPDEECVKLVCARALIVRAVYKVWEHAADHATLANKTKDYAGDPVMFQPTPFIMSSSSVSAAGTVRDEDDSTVTTPTTTPYTWCCRVEAYGRSVPGQEQVETMNTYPVLKKLPGSVKLRGSEYNVTILEDCTPIAYHTHGDKVLRHVYIGRRVSEGARGAAVPYDLKKRCFIGRTSMDAELALIMCNQALVRPGSIVMDPFCGTGSILVAAASIGACPIGGDINVENLTGRQMKKAGKTNPFKCPRKPVPDTCSIASNFDQYSLPDPLGLIVGDCSVNIFVEGRPFVDAIVCDPPYGIREGVKAVGSKRARRDDRKANVQPSKLMAVAVASSLESKDNTKEPTAVSGAGAGASAGAVTGAGAGVGAGATTESHSKETARGLPGYIEADGRQPLDESICGMLKQATQVLMPGGRLVFWLPTTDDYNDNDMPITPGLKLISKNKQTLKGALRRRLMVMEKTRNLSADEPAVVPRAHQRVPAHAGVRQAVHKQEGKP